MKDAKEPEVIAEIRAAVETEATLPLRRLRAATWLTRFKQYREILAAFDTLTRERDAERAVIEAAKVAEMTLTSMAHAEALYGGQLPDQVLDLLDAIKELRALEGDA